MIEPFDTLYSVGNRDRGEAHMPTGTQQQLSDFWQTMDISVPFVKNRDVADTGQLFDVHSVTRTPSRFGEQFVLHATELSSGKACKLGFSWSEARETRMNQIRDYVSGGTPLRIQIVSFETKNGSTAYDVAPPPSEQ